MATKLMRRFGHKIAQRDGGWSCKYCGLDLVPSYDNHDPLAPDTACIDHVFPESRGGKTKLDNLVLCCRSCNSSKGRKTLEEWEYMKAQRERDVADPLIYIRQSELYAVIDRLHRLEQALGGGQ